MLDKKDSIMATVFSWFLIALALVLVVSFGLWVLGVVVSIVKAVLLWALPFVGLAFVFYFGYHLLTQKKA